MRDHQVDRYMEHRFGKPDFSKTVTDPITRERLTPLGNKWKIYRVDPPLVAIRVGNRRG